MARLALIILNGVSAILFFIIIYLFVLAPIPIFQFANLMEIETSVADSLVDTFTGVFNSLKNVLIYAIYFVLIIIVYGMSIALSLAFSYLPFFSANFMIRFLELFFVSLLDGWFTFPKGQAPGNLMQIPGLMLQELEIFTSDFYVMIFFILLLISIIYGIRSVVQNRPKYNLASIGSLILMVVIPLMILGFRNMLDLFTINLDLLEDIVAKNPIDLDIGITTEMGINFFLYFSLFITNPVTIMAILAYIYLELAFQINYVNTVTKPSVERSGRLEAQLKVLRRESMLITANAEKIKEEAKKRRLEIGLEEKEEVTKFLSKSGEKISYVREMIERRKLEDEEKKLVSAASKTRRLGRYIERLFKEDPEAEDTITAKSSAPEARGLLISTITTFTFRVGLLIILSFIVIHPHWFFVNVFNLPPAITESVAMYSPEVVITILVPIILVFPVISQLISYVKHRNLIIRLKQEGRIKQILASVGDYVVEESKEDEDAEDEEEFIPSGPSTASEGT